MLKILVAVWIWFLVFSTSVFASGFQLKSIGVLDVTGTMSKEWWYTTANPPLSGITSAGASVTVAIDGTDYQATVDSLGSWTYAPTALTEGDHSVTLTSSAGSQAFTLHIGANIPAEASAPAQQSTPVAGSTAQTLALWLGGALILITGAVLLPLKK